MDALNELKNKNQEYGYEIHIGFIDHCAGLI